MRILLASSLVFAIACGGGGSTPDAPLSQHDAPVTLHDAPAGTDASIDGAAVDGSIDAMPAMGIAAVRAAIDGAVSIPVASVLVTYVAPAVGTDPAGVFVQSNATGPALFIAVDPTTLTPAPAVGQNVTFTATMKATQDLQPRATAVSGWTVNSSGNSITALVQDLSTATDLVTGLDNYDSELVTVTGTVIGTFANAAANHVAAEIDTTGVTGNTALKFRLPTTVRASLDLAGACVVKVGPTPLWRFSTSAEPSAWVAADVTVTSCPAPKVSGAAATAGTTMTVTFDRLVDPASVLANGSQFTSDMGLTFSAATVSGNVVTLTTSAQTAVTYTITVANTVTDTYHTAVDGTAHTATAVGFQILASLVINELNPNITGGKDLVELLATSAGTINGILLQQDVAAPVTLATLPNITVAAGDLIVVHLTPGTTTSETTTKADCVDLGCYAGAWDVNGGTAGITFSNRVLRVVAPGGVVQDAVAFAKATTLTPAGYPTDLQSIQGAGQWLPANCGGAACTYTSTPLASDATISADWTTAATTTIGNSVQRKNGQATKTAADWTLATATFGLPNL